MANAIHTVTERERVRDLRASEQHHIAVIIAITMLPYHCYYYRLFQFKYAVARLFIRRMFFTVKTI